MKFLGYGQIKGIDKVYYLNYVKIMEKWLEKIDFNLVECMYNNKKLEKNSERKNNTITKLEKLEKWFGSVPRFTTIRVNSSSVSLETVIDMIKMQLQKQADSRGRKTIPEVKQDRLLKDCIVVGCWDEQSLNFDRHPMEAIVDMKCGVAILRGADLFAPGVIAMSPETTIGSRVSVYADSAQKCLWGRTTPYTDLDDKIFVGNGIAVMTRKEIFAGSTEDKKTGKAIEMTDIPSRVASFSLPAEYGILQNYPSILCSHVLNPQPGEVVLDMCAAPGNKTTHLAALMKHQGTLIAIDRSKNKVEKLASNCRVLGCDWVQAYVYNSIEALDKRETRNVETGAVDKSARRNVKPGTLEKSETINAETGELYKSGTRNVETGALDEREASNVETGTLEKSGTRNVVTGTLDELETTNLKTGELDKSDRRNVEPGALETSETMNIETRALDKLETINVKTGELEKSETTNVETGTLELETANVETGTLDTRETKTGEQILSSVLNGPPPYPENSFDKILLDAPCSGLGQRPHINTSMTAKHINSYPNVQKRLFDTAVSLLKPGGYLVYSTCTILVQENEGLVEWALSNYGGVIELVRAEPLVGSDGVRADFMVGSSGSEWPGTSLTDDQRKCVLKFGPDMSDTDTNERLHSDTIGFFIAKFRKLPR
ncbi:tRNA (cytosine(72)-C(5))-methyltransferase NSUN6 [Nilaparvata lugens]|uniref:tRNA (cytosine(72)-C(5))-methyltransferase NSUN6 n=1 Tax=Nilaparvata lugens TaxID=108931 RepID=UPI00193CCA28|nr:tRNA (cytosine(72)-C(5))-methyltransferase NSUN6 [Nilaparvata lugens]XP_039292854.1 tRNA (cytosine(72)-C(5))-methyltransferase NSUN6 [Nilaparvata lugens]